MKRLRLLLILFIGVSAVSLSAETILTKNIRVYSENRAYYAAISLTLDRVSSLSVRKVSSGDELWSSWLDWGADYAGYLSNDGGRFVAVNRVYSEYVNLITVYSRGKQDAYTVQSIPIKREYLRAVDGRYVWTDFETNGSRFVYDASGAASSFEIGRNDARVSVVPLK